MVGQIARRTPVNLPAFDHFAAIDWSGARGQHHKGIALAICAAGDGTPRIIAPPSSAGWARGEIAQWLEDFPGSLLAGFDFSFAPPFIDRGAYLPGIDAPDGAPDFWRWIDALCPDADYGAHGFIDEAGRAHFWMGTDDGPKADFQRWRQCELAFNSTGGGKAASIFDCMGAAQVAKASFAGMRVVRRLQAGFAIWPFDAPAPRTIVEIYARAMLRLAGGNGRKLRDATALNQALSAFDSQPMPADARFSDHESDAIITAAALRHLAHRPQYWTPAGLTAKIARTEGWTFGIV